MKTLFKYIITLILGYILAVVCGVLMLFASALDNNILVCLCVVGAVVGAVAISKLIAEVE